MDIGIIGLPTSGKTTIFNALTRGDRPTAAASLGKLDIYSAIVDVPDTRVDQLSELFKPRKTTYAKVTYTDIAGLDKEIGKSGISGQLRNQIATMDAFLHVVRAFDTPHSPHPLGSVDPERDLTTLNDEMLLADLVTVENRLERIAEGMAKGARGEERQRLQAEEGFFNRLRTHLEKNLPLRTLDLSTEEEDVLRGFGLLTRKPVLVLLNTDESSTEAQLTYDAPNVTVLPLQGQLEMELAQLADEDAEIFMAEYGITELSLSRVIRASYELLDLISFFTINEDEVRAWTVKRGATALEAAGTIHTDLARGFIRAEVTPHTTMMEFGSLVAARKAGKTSVEGKEYLVKDGDLLHVRFSV